jgi:uncharacterized Zn finger protein
LKILILFRLDNKVKKLTAEKLLPCTDCYDKYVIDLKKNNGVLIIISEESEAKHFLKNNQELKELKYGDFRLMFFKGEELEQLNLEPKI